MLPYLIPHYRTWRDKVLQWTGHLDSNQMPDVLPTSVTKVPYEF